MAVEKKKEEEQEELVAVGENLDEESSKREDEDKDEDKDKDKDKESEEEDELDEEDEDEERLGASEEEDKDDAKKIKKRSRRSKRRKDARDRDQTEMNFLRSRNETLERKFSELDERVGYSETTQVDTRINDVKGKIKLADQVMSKAFSSQDGDAYIEAQNIRDELRDELTQLSTAKTYMTTQRRTAEQETTDPRLMQHASRWMRDHSWWDPSGGDSDSKTVSRIDNALVNEGYDPTDQEYWDELSDRVEAALPERYGNGEDTGGRKKKKAKKKASGPTFSTGGRERPLKKNEVYISPERKEAMIEAGVWEDPELRQKYLKSYAKYDSENRA